MNDLVKSSSVSPARLAAFEILLRVEEGAYASVLLAAREAELSKADRALCHELVLGVLRRLLWLDHLIEHYAEREASGLDVAVRIILRLGLYQLRFLSRVPASAAVNESVNLVHLARKRSAGGLVNAVLRRATREPDFDPTTEIQNPIEKIAVAQSHPTWLIERWTKAFGAEEASAFAAANNEPAPVSFRVVQSRGRQAEIIDRLRAAGASVSPSQITPSAWRIASPGILGSVLMDMAGNGEVYLQDEASQLLAEVLDAQPGQLVLDLCAAPGGKTTQIADGLRDSGTVIASDLHEHRLRTVAASAQLQALSNIHLVTLNGLQPLPLTASFDRVLVDAPCSGTGTLRRNPEIRWRISPADIHDLSERQKQLLFNASRVVKPGGRLIYSTCSVEIDENEDVRQQFLENNLNFKPADLGIGASLMVAEGAARTWPHRDGVDGFFMCAFERKCE